MDVKQFEILNAIQYPSMSLINILFQEGNGMKQLALKTATKHFASNDLLQSW